MRLKRAAVVCGFFYLLIASWAHAERLHVRVDGTRSSGVSVPGDWDLANCYPTLAAAAAEVAPADTLLLFAEQHSVTTAVTLAAYLGNMSLGDDPQGVDLQLAETAQLVLNDQQPFAQVRGVHFWSDGEYRAYSALVLDDLAGGIDSLLVEGCNFTDLFGGYADEGGSCLSALNGGGHTSITVRNCEFDNNATRGWGGSIRIKDGFAVSIQGCDFRDNRAEDDGAWGPRGGALGVRSPDQISYIDIRDSRFENNMSIGPGGAIAIEDASLTITGCDVTGSRSAYDGTWPWTAGAGLFMRRSEDGHLDPIVVFEASDCRFIDNVANLTGGTGGGDGGGVLVRGDLGRYVDVTVTDCEFADNFNAQGAGLYVGRFATGNVERCRFVNNIAHSSGGATYKGGALVENLGETAYYIYCEFIGNKAGFDLDGNTVDTDARGGAFTTRLNPRAEFINCSFSDNIVGGNNPRGDAIALVVEGGAFDDDLKRCVLINSAFYGDVGNSIQIYSHTAGFSNVSHCAYAEGQFQAIDVEPIETVLLTESPYVSNVDLHLTLDSPLRDAALDLGPTQDIEGTEVPQGDGVDIGAYEFVDTSAVPPPDPLLWFLEAYPNPFNPRTTIAYDTVVAGQIQLAIYDLRGRQLVVLADEFVAAGRREWVWDGCDASGVTLPSGAYFARIQTTRGAQNLKLMLVR